MYPLRRNCNIGCDLPALRTGLRPQARVFHFPVQHIRVRIGRGCGVPNRPFIPSEIRLPG